MFQGDPEAREGKEETRGRDFLEGPRVRVDATLSSSVHSGKRGAAAAGPGCNPTFLCNVLPYPRFLQLLPLEPLH